MSEHLFDIFYEVTTQICWVLTVHAHMRTHIPTELSGAGMCSIESISTSSVGLHVCCACSESSRDCKMVI